MSKGFALWELDGVDMSEARGRPCVLSAEGITSDANVSCDGFSISRVVAVCTFKPVFSFPSWGVVEAMVVDGVVVVGE